MLNLKTRLQQAGISQADLARAVNLSPATIAQLLNKEIWPSTPDRAALQAALSTALTARGIAVYAALFESAPTVDAAETDNTLNPEVYDMLLRKQSLSPAAKKHFGLFRDPFADDVQTHEDVFISPDIRYVREALFQTAKHGGFMAAVGESGAGKSTLRRDLIDRIARESQPIIVIEPYVLGMEDNDQKGKTLKALHIAEAILNTVAPLEPIKRSPEARFRQLHRVLRDSRRSGNSHALIIEEAHGIPIPTIKHLKRFFELEDGFKKLLSIILIGQPELKLKLSESNHEVREVVQRCEIVKLTPLDNHLEEYLAFKLGRIGKSLTEIIDTSGIEALRAKLTISTNRRDHRTGSSGRDTVSLLYPLTVGNLFTACLNLAADIGAPLVTANVVKEA